MKLTRDQKFMVAVLLCGALLVILNTNLLSPALPTLMEEFDVSATTVQWLTSGYTLAEAVIVPLSAYFVGRFSTRRLFGGGIGIFTIGSLLAALAPAFPVLLVARVMQAIGAGILIPMSVSLVTVIFPRERRGSAMGLISLAIGFAPAIGPVLGGLLVDTAGWRALFLLVAVLGFLVFLFGMKALVNYEGFERYQLDVPSVALMACGMVCLLYGISSTTSADVIAVPIVLIVVGVALLAVFVVRQLRLEQPMLKVTVLTTYEFRTNVITVMLLQASLIGCGVILPLYVQNVLGYSATVSGLIMLPGAVLGAIAGFVAGRLYDRYGVRGLAVIGVTILLLSGIGMTTLGIDSSAVYVMLMYSGLALGVQMLTTPMNTWGINSLDNSLIQHANSLLNSLNQVASSIGTALLTALTALGAWAVPNGTELEQTFAGDHIAFCGLCAITVVCAFVVYFFARNRKGRDGGKGKARADDAADDSGAVGEAGAQGADAARATSRGPDAAWATSHAAGAAAAVGDAGANGAAGYEGEGAGALRARTTRAMPGTERRMDEAPRRTENLQERLTRRASSQVEAGPLQRRVLA